MKDLKALLPFVDELESQITDVDAVSYLVNSTWIVKKKTSSSIMTPELMKIEETLVSNENVKAIRLCGAGSGGHFLTLCNCPIEDSKLINIDDVGVKGWKI